MDQPTTTLDERQAAYQFWGLVMAGAAVFLILLAAVVGCTIVVSNGNDNRRRSVEACTEVGGVWTDNGACIVTGSVGTK